MDTIRACPTTKAAISRKRPQKAWLTLTRRAALPRFSVSTSTRKMTTSTKAPIHSVRFVNREAMPEP